MNLYLLIFLRIVHVMAGILWGGTAIFYLFFVKPSVKSIGPAAPQFMQNLAERRRYPVFMASASLLTVLAGGALYWNSSGGFNPAWIRTGPGIGFTIGSATALVAFLVGNLGIGPTTARLGALGRQIEVSSGQHAQEQLVQMETLEKKLNRAEWIDFAMLAISMLMMATARYWVF